MDTLPGMSLRGLLVPNRPDRPWTVPWEGGSGALEVFQNEGETIVSIDRRRVGAFPAPSCLDRWAEHPVAGSQPPITVARAFFPQRRFRTVVFVGGVSLEDGLSLQQWRAAPLPPLDEFEREFLDSPYFGSGMAVLMGGGGFLAYWLGHGASAGNVILSVAAALASAGWFWGLGGKLAIPWLARRRSWPAPVRRLVLAGILSSVGLAAALVLSGAVALR